MALSVMNRYSKSFKCYLFAKVPFNSLENNQKDL